MGTQGSGWDRSLPASNTHKSEVSGSAPAAEGSGGEVCTRSRFLGPPKNKLFDLAPGGRQATRREMADLDVSESLGKNLGVPVRGALGLGVGFLG